MGIDINAGCECVVCVVHLCCGMCVVYLHVCGVCLCIAYLCVCVCMYCVFVCVMHVLCTCVTCAHVVSACVCCVCDADNQENWRVNVASLMRSLAPRTHSPCPCHHSHAL